MKSLQRKFAILLITIIISIGTSSFIFSTGLEKTNYVCKKHFPFDPHIKLTYETTFGETICVTRLYGEEYIQHL